MDRKEVDFIIVGQGLAGTSMAMRLLEEGKSLVIIDEGKEQSASLISSGIINPITGRRYVKSWKFDDLLPSALEFYKKLEQRWNAKIIKPIQLLRALSSALKKNQRYCSSRRNHPTLYDTVPRLQDNPAGRMIHPPMGGGRKEGRKRKRRIVQ